MSIRTLIHMAMEYLELGVLVSIVFLIGALFYRRKKKKAGRPISDVKIFWGFVFLMYIVVLLCATLARSGGYENALKLQPFSSYIMAWNSASPAEWRNLFINILLFVPFGFLVPFLWEKGKTFWCAYAAGGIVSILIECLQFVFKRGIVEFDDVLNNVVGTMIGYGVYRLFAWVISRIKKENAKLRGILWYQLPAVVVVAGYLIVFFTYTQMEWGTLACRPSAMVNMSGINVASNCQWNTEKTADYIYDGKVLSQGECQMFATHYLEQLGYQIDEKQTMFYEDMAIFKTEHGRYILNVYYRGGGYELIDFGEGQELQNSETYLSGLSEEEVRTVLQTYHVELPAEVKCQEVEEGNYQLSTPMTQEGNTWKCGWCQVLPVAEDRVGSFRNEILEFTEREKVKIISEEEAYEQLKEGTFIKPEGVDQLHEMLVTGVELLHEVDSKGYAQPVYEFLVVLNGDEKNIARIRVPAVA
nr:VanZ family protein [Eubacterium sp.]